MSSKITIWLSREHGDFSSLYGFRYWKLKEVAGYRLDVHCQACLLGNCDRRFNAKQPVGARAETIAEILAAMQRDLRRMESAFRVAAAQDDLAA